LGEVVSSSDVDTGALELEWLAVDASLRKT
jgi:hypothetical protein